MGTPVVPVYSGREEGAVAWVLEQALQELMGKFENFEFRKFPVFTQETFLYLPCFQARVLLPF